MAETKKRDSVKYKLSLFIKFLDNFKNKSAEEIGDENFIQIEERLNETRNYIHEFEEVQNLVETKYKGDNIIEEVYSERDKFQNEYYPAIALAKSILKLQKIISNDDNTSVASGSGDSVARSDAGLGLIKLPEMPLPKFDGKPLEWLEFRDSFELLIHNNASISNIQKFHYLRASLTSQAAQIIKSFDFAASTYESAWKCLIERFDNTRVLVDNHVKALINTEPILKGSSENLQKLVDSLSKNLRALGQLNQSVDNWDILVVALATEKLDKNTKYELEKLKSTKKDPLTLTEFKKFLTARADFLQTMERNTSGEKAHEKRFDKGQSHNTRGFLATDSADVSSTSSCVVCKKGHYIQNCPTFLSLSVFERFDKVKSLRLCIICLYAGHVSKVCRKSTCRKCHNKHHTLLHMEFNTDSKNSQSDSASSLKEDKNKSNVDKNNETVTSLAYSTSGCTEDYCTLTNNVLLSTAYVYIFDKTGKQHSVNVLLDSGSQSSYIREDLCKKLNLKTESVDVSVKGLNNMSSKINKKCSVRVDSQCYSFSITLNCLVSKQITGNLPNISIDASKIIIPPNIKLADPEFAKPKRVDMLIGSDVFWNLICNGQISLGKNKPILQKSRFGWIVAGPVCDSSLLVNSTYCNFSQSFENEINSRLTRFWEIEECSLSKVQSPDEIACENHYLENMERDKDGRFIVALPLKESISKLGDSFEMAKKRFLSLERNRLQRDEKFKVLYSDFMSEYLSLNHMKKVDENLVPKFAYHLPHHGVMREESLTTRPRCVFDGSAPSTSGYSLNHLQMAGPTIQQDLFSILLRFRKHTYVLAADIAKMYRQVLIKPEERSLQRILWCFNTNQPIDVFELQTVTYGLKAASFLAIRSIFQLAIENEKKFPDLAEIIKTDFYVDDLITGTESVEDAIRICNGISDILKQGCFQLRKFYSNNSEIIEHIPDSDLRSKVVNFGLNENAKTLGLIWCPTKDTLMFSITENLETQKISKRQILSSVSQVFDPLGIVSPCIIVAKIIMQKIWLEKISWDESLPLHIHTLWSSFRKELPLLNNLRVDRHDICTNPVNVEMHSFCDAALNAYGGCIYLRSVDIDGNIFVNLLCAKSKVSPIKTVSLPRLELCGAVVVARFAKKVSDALKINISRRIFWTDSSIVISWLKTEPNKLKTFVSNRVSEIQGLTENDTWRHVPSESNPCDVLSRGVRPSEILNLRIWWHGPDWLQNGKSLARNIVHQCLRCFRFKAKTISPIMGNLPELRVTPGDPFQVVGVDYAGPLLIKDKPGRGCKITKAYISLFVCFVTKAVHLELVTDLSRDSFLMALKRFSSRRGKPQKVFSDNGTNFVATNNELKSLGKFISKNEKELVSSITKENIDWEFIPPNSPHFGGLWEAGVKSSKFHIKRVAGNVALTFEKLYTLLVQIEAVLNSRPLTPMSSHPDDFNPITPAHFLVGRPLTSVPEQNCSTIPNNRLSVFQHVQKMRHHFWQHWSKEFICELQHRSKWKQTKGSLKEGTLVIVKDDNTPPLKWKLGRILQTHPGLDSVSRVATIPTPQGIIKRSFSKICPLPSEEGSDI